MKQIPLAIGPEPLMTFDSFVSGANEAALAHLRALAAEGGAPVYLWGASGSGKTHLLRALAWTLQPSAASTAWFDAADPLPWTLSPTTTR